MHILTLNPGSATLKLALFVENDGRLDRVGGARVAAYGRERSEIRIKRGPDERTIVSESAARGDQLRQAISELTGDGYIDAIGCRVVHGGSLFVEPLLIDDDSLKKLDALSELAPLHNPVSVDAIELVREVLSGVPVVAVFDTAFHRSLPEVAHTYALPRELREKLAIRRYGFHGISHAFVSREMIRLLGNPSARRIVSCHLGNGASICAIRDGISIDVSMGMTPLEGLVMGTRAGDIDPGVILHLLRHGFDEKRLDELLNKQSGLLGISGTTGDVRELDEAAASGDERAELALEVFAYRAAKYIGAYSVALEGLDAIIFTAGIGEKSPSMRKRICRRLAFLGVTLDDAANDHANGSANARIDNGRVQVWVIPTDEEQEIARAVRV